MNMITVGVSKVANWVLHLIRSVLIVSLNVGSNAETKTSAPAYSQDNSVAVLRSWLLSNN